MDIKEDTMATAPKKHMYRLQYEDNTYQVVELTKKEYDILADAICDQFHAVKFDEYILRVKDIRTVVFLPPAPPPTEEEKAQMKNMAEQQLSEWGFADQETLEWLRNVGIDITKEAN